MDVNKSYILHVVEDGKIKTSMYVGRFLRMYRGGSGDITTWKFMDDDDSVRSFTDKRWNKQASIKFEEVKEW